MVAESQAKGTIMKTRSYERVLKDAEDLCSKGEGELEKIVLAHMMIGCLASEVERLEKQVAEITERKTI